VPSEPWLSIKVELLSGRGLVLEHPPGRMMIASPRHTLAELAEAIDVSFARWDHSHLHVFEFGDGRRYMLGGSEFEPDVTDSTEATLREFDLRRSSRFEYVFDLGDDWRHACEVQATDLDPEDEYGAPPEQPVPIWGWGWIPDQYGRVDEDE
jgi:Plasmid pRiA4b ORF-3-like protein